MRRRGMTPGIRLYPDLELHALTYENVQVHDLGLLVDRGNELSRRRLVDIVRAYWATRANRYVASSRTQP